MRAAKSGKRPVSKVEDGALVRRLTGALPRVAAKGRNRSTEWISRHGRNSGRQVPESRCSKRTRGWPVCWAGSLRKRPIFGTWCVPIRRALSGCLPTNSPKRNRQSYWPKCAESGGAVAPVLASVMRILRRMKADAALLVALADIGGVWPLARVTAALMM